MEFKKYKRLKKAVLSAKTFGEFLNEVVKWPRHYAVITPKNWTKLDYEWFYNQIKGGCNYARLFTEAA